MNQKWTALLVALGLTAAVTAGCGNQAGPFIQTGRFRPCDGDHEAL